VEDILEVFVLVHQLTIDIHPLHSGKRTVFHVLAKALSCGWPGRSLKKLE